MHRSFRSWLSLLLSCLGWPDKTEQLHNKGLDEYSKEHIIDDVDDEQDHIVDDDEDLPPPPSMTVQEKTFDPFATVLSESTITNEENTDVESYRNNDILVSLPVVLSVYSTTTNC